MYGSCKENFRRRAAALQGSLTKQMPYIADFPQKGFLEMTYSYIISDFSILVNQQICTSDDIIFSF